MSPQRILGLLVLAPWLGVADYARGQGFQGFIESWHRSCQGIRSKSRNVAAHEPKAKAAPKPKVSPTPVARDARGRIQRSDAARREADRVSEWSPRVCHRPHQAARVWWGRCTVQYGVADRRGGQGKG